MITWSHFFFYIVRKKKVGGEMLEKEEGSKLYLGEWVELEDVIKNSSEIEMVQNKLIELSDKEIGIQNEEIKNIEDDFEELDEVEK